MNPTGKLVPVFIVLALTFGIMGIRPVTAAAAKARLGIVPTPDPDLGLLA